MQLADNHCHISKQYFDNPLDEIQELSKNSGLEYINIMGVDYKNNLEYLDYKDRIDNEFLRIGFGLHPSDIIELKEKSIEEFKKIIKQIEDNKNKIDFIGEIGIDFTYPNAEEFKEKQIEIFNGFCELGMKLSKPLSIHCREAWNEVMEIIEKVSFDEKRFNGFLHSFTGDFEQGMFFIEHGFKLGLNGIITFKKSEELRNVIREILVFYNDKNFDDLFGLETDTPYLSPEPNRSDKNNPRNILKIAEYLTENFKDYL